MAQRGRSSDLILIVSALLIAYFIWLIGKMGNVEQRELGVPVVIEVPEYIEAVPSRRFVSVEVRYPKSQRREVHSGAFQVVVRDPALLTQAGVHESQAVEVPLVPDDVRCLSLPPSVQVQKVEPSPIAVSVRFRTRPARIEPQLVGQPPPGYRIESEKTLIEQRERLLTGGQERLNALRPNKDGVIPLQTSPIPLTGHYDSFSTLVAVQLPEGVGLLDEERRQRLTRDVSFARVGCIIVTTRTLEGIPVQVPTLARNLVAQTEPSTSAVTLEGPRTLLDKLDRSLVQVRPKNPPEEIPGLVGDIAIEARLAESVSPDVRVLAVRPDVVLLRYVTKTSEQSTSPTSATP